MSKRNIRQSVVPNFSVTVIRGFDCAASQTIDATAVPNACKYLFSNIVHVLLPTHAFPPLYLELPSCRRTWWAFLGRKAPTLLSAGRQGGVWQLRNLRPRSDWADNALLPPSTQAPLGRMAQHQRKAQEVGQEPRNACLTGTAFRSPGAGRHPHER